MLITTENEQLTENFIRTEIHTLSFGADYGVCRGTEGSDALWVNVADVGPIVSKQGLKRQSSTASDVWLITSFVTQSESEQTEYRHSAAYELSVCVPRDMSRDNGLQIPD